MSTIPSRPAVTAPGGGHRAIRYAPNRREPPPVPGHGTARYRGRSLHARPCDTECAGCRAQRDSDERERRAPAADRPLRVTLCPVNTAGVPWTLAQALRRRGVDARLVVFERYGLHPEADVSLDRSGGFARRQATQWSALARLLPTTDVFHFIFGLTLVPQSLQFPILRATRRKSVMHYLGSDIRGKTPGATRLREEGRRRDRRQLRRDPLGSGGKRDPARDRPLAHRPLATVGPRRAR